MVEYRVTASRLNVRSGPGKQFEVIGQVERGEVVEALDSTGWLPIEMEDGSVGWVATQFLEAVSKAAPPVDERTATVRRIVEECKRQGLGLSEQIAYVLATVEWETARTFKPVREAYWKTEEWRRANLRYYPYYGRGYVQLTWRDNYARYTERLKKRFPERADRIDLVREPDQALDPEFALFILVDGFKTGAFTGKKLTDYVNDYQTDFVNARRCINALDRADTIARMAEVWLSRLQRGEV